MTAGPFKTTALLLLLIGVTASAQNLLPNQGFEEGTDRPTGWKLSGDAGEWSNAAYAGKRCLEVKGNGKGSSAWRTDNLRLEAGGLYRLSFYARRTPGTSGGCAISGLSRVNRDFRLSDTWQRYSFVFSVPQDGTNDYLRLGQWEVNGQLFFDDVELCPVLGVHGNWFGGSGVMGKVGEAESLTRGVYQFQPNYAWAGANNHLPLWRNRASFNSDRWSFGPGNELVYRFAQPVPQTNGRISLAINYYVSGTLRVEASRDAAAWVTVANYDGKQRGGTTNLPANLFPATNIFIRLALSGAEGNLQMNSFSYQSALKWPPISSEGSTHFLDVLQVDPDLHVRLFEMTWNKGEREARCSFLLSNATPRGLSLAITPTNWPKRDSSLEYTELMGNRWRILQSHAVLNDVGNHSIYWKVFDQNQRTLFLGRSEASFGFLYDPRPGYYVTCTDMLDVWWCESGWKIGKRLMLPDPPTNAAPKPVRVSAGKGEYEAVQVILRPSTRNETLTSAAVGSFTNGRGESAPISVRIDELAYVNVKQPTDATGERDWYPDPLPPLALPRTLFMKENKPLWLTFYVPRETKAGDYAGELKLQTSAGNLTVPLAVHVYDFELPRETHLRSALGLGAGEINRYHRLSEPEHKKAVYEKYLRNFAEHRISPYSFFDGASFDVRFTGPASNRQAQVDFTKFDAAATKWLDEYRFNSFLLPLRGMGGGTFHSRHLGELEGFKEGTPEHARLFNDYLGQIEGHLKERGWLDKAYTYWFDEPDPKDYQFVVDGMKRIRAAAPGLKRMLTEQPEPGLIGNVEIWCGLTPEWTREKVAERRKAGEEVWWYICCAPKAPYLTEFIDHPGTELRLWPWQSWQYGVQGILIWATIYWTSSSAFPPPQLQDPWADPMSYVSGYSFGPGHIGYWGNGDGRFLYPPKPGSAGDKKPRLEDPINSFRWENLRDGMEDYEYFWLLNQAIERVEKAGGATDLTRQARALLSIPDHISKDLTHFTTDPRPILEHRSRIAVMIEKLQKSEN